MPRAGLSLLSDPPMWKGGSGVTPPPWSRQGSPAGVGTERRVQLSCWKSGVARGGHWPDGADCRQLLSHTETSRPFLKNSPPYTCISRAFWMKSPNCENHDYGQLCKLAYLADILAHADNARSSWEGGLSRHQYSTCGTGEAPVAGGGVFSWFRWPGGKLTWRSR